MNEVAPKEDQDSSQQRAKPLNDYISQPLGCAVGKQSALMVDFLYAHGFDVEYLNGYPAFRERFVCQLREALPLILQNRKKLPGWWNLHPLFMEKGTCTEKEFKDAKDGKDIPRIDNPTEPSTIEGEAPEPDDHRVS